MCAADGSVAGKGTPSTAPKPVMGMLRKRMPAAQTGAFTRATQTASRATGLFGSSMLTGGSTLLGG